MRDKQTKQTKVVQQNSLSKLTPAANVERITKAASLVAPLSGSSLQNLRSLMREVNPRKLRNNTQRTLVALLRSENEWVPRTQLHVPSLRSRISELRSPTVGLAVECRTAKALNRKSRSTKTKQPTYYRVNPESVTLERVTRVLRGVI